MSCSLNRIFISVVVLLAAFLVQRKAVGQPDTLKILTWNLYMRPHCVFWNQQIKRAHAIVDQLQKADVDIIVFQETFDSKARKILRDGLSAKFPNQHGPGKGGFFHLNSGVWIISKYAYTQADMERYDDCAREDCMARKSASFVAINYGKYPIQLFGTHLQAIDGDKYSDVRESQMRVIATMRDRYNKDGVAQIFAGDMNTARDNEIRHANMLKILDCEDGEPSGTIKTSSRDATNDISRKGVGDGPQLIDYIMLRSNNGGARIVKREVVRYQQEMKGGRKDLSDHFEIGRAHV